MKGRRKSTFVAMLAARRRSMERTSFRGGMDGEERPCYDSLPREGEGLQKYLLKSSHISTHISRGFGLLTPTKDGLKGRAIRFRHTSLQALLLIYLLVIRLANPAATSKSLLSPTNSRRQRKDAPLRR
jgi:hypothetical protein